MKDTRGGLALIIVAGVLGLMAALAMAFTTLAQLERRASRQRLNATKATLLARSGLEDAMARLGAGQDSDAPSTRYQGEDWDWDPLINPSHILSSREAASEVYRPAGAAQPADTDACPVRHAMRPSFWAAKAGAPDLLNVGGRERGYSGSLSSTRAGNYALKVTTEGGFYVNGGDPSVSVNTAVSDYNLNLRRMLGILAEAVDREDGVAGDGPVGQADGFNVINQRPKEGWTGWDQVRDLAFQADLPSVRQAKLDALRPYLALHARVDRKVIRPNAPAPTAPGYPKSWADIKMAHETYPLALGTKEPDFERIPVLPGGKLVGRAPVDLAWARTRRPVLIALLANLKGLLLDETVAKPYGTGLGTGDDSVGKRQSAVIALDWTATSDECRRVADRILVSTSELKTWDQWNAFVDAVIVDPAQADYAAAQTASSSASAAYSAAIGAATNAGGVYVNAVNARIAALADYNNNPNAATLAAYNAALAAEAAALAASQAAIAARNAAQTVYFAAYNAAQAVYVALTGRYLLKANFNPNSDLNKFGPNVSLWKGVDKSDLLVHSTEFSLLPQACAQELECVGRVLGRNGRLLASRVLRATIAPAGILTLTTQKEFVCDDLGDPSVPGDEVSPRLPGAFPFISQSLGTGRTWGNRLDMTGPYPGTWMNGTSSGAGLQTYPEPCVDSRPYPQTPPAVLSIRPADYDGSVQLATVETADNDFFMADSGTPTAAMKLLARYTAGLDLDLGADRFNLPGTNQVTYTGGGSANPLELGNGLWHPSRPNTLYPDGIYSEKDRAPSYRSLGNADGFHGVISLWIKSHSARGHLFFNGSNYTSTAYNAAANPDQAFMLADAYGTAGGVDVGVSVNGYVEVSHSTAELLNEHIFQYRRMPTLHRWFLVTMYYDLRSPGQHDCGKLLVDAGLTATSDGGLQDTYPGSTGNASTTAEDITTPPTAYSPHRLTLGYGVGRPLGQYGNLKKSIGSGADATFDELAIYDFGGATLVSGIGTAALPATAASPGILAAARFKDGRYYKESAYPSSGGLLVAQGANRNAGEYFSPRIRLGPCRIRALAWTQVVPRGLKAPFTGGQVGVDGDPAEGPVNPGDGDPGDGRIVLELADSSGTGYLQDASGTSINTLFTRSALERVDRTVAAPFRLHAVFQPNLKDRENTPILDPLALDDVTVVYEPQGGRRIVTWGQGE